MKKENIQLFADWCFKNKELKETNYFTTSFKNDTNLFLKQVSLWADVFENSYGYNPFDKNYKGMTFTFIEHLQNNLKNKNAVYESEKLSTDFVAIERLINSHYIKFLALNLYGEDLELYNNSQKSLKLESEVPFGKEFAVWLEMDQNLTKGSADSYLSYVKKLNEEVLLTDGKPNFFFNSIKFFYNNGDSISLLKLLNNSINIINMNPDNDMKYKYKSGLEKYRDYLMS